MKLFDLMEDRHCSLFPEIFGEKNKKKIL